jgi:hypothetical protein
VPRLKLPLTEREEVLPRIVKNNILNLAELEESDIIMEDGTALLGNRPGMKTRR